MKKKPFDFGAVGQAEAPKTTPGGVTEVELAVLVDHLVQNPMQGANLQEYWKNFAEEVRSYHFSVIDLLTLVDPPSMGTLIKRCPALCCVLLTTGP